MKVWEETWRMTYDRHIHAWDIVDAKDETSLAHRGMFSSADDPGYDEARTRLASAAPEMARALMAIEWSATDYTGSASECPSCGAEEGTGGTSGQHLDTCALSAALRKAGVLK